MDRIVINGGKALHGSIKIAGSKNAVLPIMAASLLCEGTVVLRNVPKITDVTYMIELMSGLGAMIEVQEQDHVQTLFIRTDKITNCVIENELACKLRASVLLLGAVLARNGNVTIRMPGGCAIGARPIDFHVAALRAMGANITENANYVTASGQITGGDLTLPNVSVGATENILLAAANSNGKTYIHNMAMEPEVLELIKFLQKMGANIAIMGNSTCMVRGSTNLYGCEHTVSCDRIEAGTYGMALAAAGGSVALLGVTMANNRPWMQVLARMGVTITEAQEGILLERKEALLPINVTTRPHPYFPSDLQAPLTAVAVYALGISVICETLYENRFMHVASLRAMGASIEIVDNKVIINGGRGKLHGGNIEATDLRAAGALVVAALAAEGQSIIKNVEYIDRGYQDIEAKLALCGADILRLRG